MPMVPSKLPPEFYRFLAMFSWHPPEDILALKRLKDLHDPENLKKKFGIFNSQGFYLTGRRTFIFVGFTKAAINLQKLCSSVTFGIPIQAEVSHVVDAHELGEILSPKRR